jgi:DNA-binding NtrC family response regulator
METKMSTKAVKVLLIEDSAAQQMFLQKSIKLSTAHRFEIKCASSLGQGLETANGEAFDVVLLDLNLPDSMGKDTLLRFQDKHPSLPVVILTSTESDTLGQSLVHAGAQDYLIKTDIGTRALARALVHAIERKQLAVEREKLLQELQTALAQIKTLGGLVPICSYCKKIRDDSGYWSSVEMYLSQNSDATFSHGVCPECYSDVMRAMKKTPVGS